MATGFTRKIFKVSVLLLLVILLAAGIGSGYVLKKLKQSLPELEGEITSEIVSLPVKVERDNLGTVTVSGSSRTDLAAALGFCHAQERYFHMDLLRRKSAGELSGLVGPAAIPADREARIHRFRSRAREFAGTMPTPEKELLLSYVKGVNAGLSALDEKPFEYLLLKQDPVPWKIEDTLLVVYAMYLDLQGDYPAMESARGLMHDLLPREMFRFLAPDGTEWEAPVDGEPFATPDIPGPEVFSLASFVTGSIPAPGVAGNILFSSDAPAAPYPPRSTAFPYPHPGAPTPGGAGRGSAHPHSTVASSYSALQAGSNNWAVSGRHTVHGKPIVADDMHLGLMVPNIWFRASLVLSAAAREQRVTGVTLPGTPLVIAGSNGKVAWGFTNSQGDWLDLVILEPGPDEDTYMTPKGPLPLKRIEEKIIASDGTEEVLEIEETIWGPVVKTDYQGRKLAARWVAYDPNGVNLRLSQLETSSSLEEALDIAARCGLPAQNFTVADRDGNIGWTICGPIPVRSGYDGRIPRSWASGENAWEGYLEPDEYPRILNPEGGRIWTANARVVSGEMLEKVGFGGYALGPRARQIRDDLFALDKASEKDLLEVQLDHRAVFHERWRNLLLEDVLTPDALLVNSKLEEARRLAENWGGKASPESAGYQIVRRFRNILADRIFSALTAECREADEDFHYYRVSQSEGPLWKLVTEKPRHMLPAEYDSWDALMLSTMEKVLTEAQVEMDSLGISSLSGWTWGVRNTAEIRHPLSPFLPAFFSRYLDAPRDQLPGDSRMPRAQGPGFGASERMVVSPGLEEQGIFHMPGGQSGHPLSPFYLSGHADWVQGSPTPFLPGETLYTLMLLPM